MEEKYQILGDFFVEVENILANAPSESKAAFIKDYFETTKRKLDSLELA